jgi:hypothetical protein
MRVLAIHPRGRKYDSEKESKKGFSLPTGKTLKSKLDWIAASIGDLIDGFYFTAKTNKLLHQVSMLHGLITDSLPLNSRLDAYKRLIDLSIDLADSVKDLYMDEALRKEVDLNMIKKLVKVIEDIDKEKNEFLDTIEQIKSAEKKLTKLGFK